MDGDQGRGITSPMYLRNSLHISRSCDIVKQQTFLLSQHEREEGKGSIKKRVRREQEMI